MQEKEKVRWAFFSFLFFFNNSHPIHVSAIRVNHIKISRESASAAKCWTKRAEKREYFWRIELTRKYLYLTLFVRQMNRTNERRCWKHKNKDLNSLPSKWNHLEQRKDFYHFRLAKALDSRFVCIFLCFSILCVVWSVERRLYPIEPMCTVMVILWCKCECFSRCIRLFRMWIRTKCYGLQIR